jgi:predicted DNA-binding transcriptional regulator AlpA
MDDVLWTPLDVQAFTGLPVGTLYQYRTRGIGPPSFRVGSHVRYWKSDVLAWLNERQAAEHRYALKVERRPATKRRGHR